LIKGQGLFLGKLKIFVNKKVRMKLQKLTLNGIKSVPKRRSDREQ